MQALPKKKETRIFKEVSPVQSGGLRRVMIRADNYNHSWPHLKRLVGILRADFPHVPDDEIDVVIYNDRHNKRQMGVECSIPANVSVPDGYKQVSAVWQTF